MDSARLFYMDTCCQLPSIAGFSRRVGNSDRYNVSLVVVELLSLGGRVVQAGLEALHFEEREFGWVFLHEVVAHRLVDSLFVFVLLAELAALKCPIVVLEWHRWQCVHF